ncbi:MAG: hypothetical protein ACFE91_01110 [Promethearchaeota archaeon]
MFFNLQIEIIYGIVFGILFLIIDYYHETYSSYFKSGKSREVYTSFVAGVSVSYFFLFLLPKITTALQNSQFKFIDFLFILIGFSFIHITEKAIFKRIQAKQHLKIKEFRHMEKVLEVKEKETEKYIKSSLNDNMQEDFMIKNLVKRLCNCIDEESNLKSQISKIEYNIESQINIGINNFNSITNFFYHLLIGIILFDLLVIDSLSALLFFFFAFFKASISTVSNRYIKLKNSIQFFEWHENNGKRIFLASATLMGILIGILSEIFLPVSKEFIYILLSFISGVILYIIVREVIPYEEKGHPFYFFIGLLIFSLIIFFSGIH